MDVNKDFNKHSFQNCWAGPMTIHQVKKSDLCDGYGGLMLV